ncbi:MAG: hypothetical protein MAG453_01615 [Calditrichaeota bacterium]|nr:hypothetical protein [Calditrichota bacterium]
MKKPIWFALLAALLAAGLLAGCSAGKKMQRTEEGYAPSHVAVEEIVAYTQGVAQVSTADMRKMIIDYLEMAFREQGVSFVSQKEMPTTPVAPENIVKLNATVTFQQGASDITESTDARISYNLVRASDGFLWREGSARTTDWSVSQGATVDVRAAVEFAAKATAQNIGEMME